MADYAALLNLEKKPFSPKPEAKSPIASFDEERLQPIIQREKINTPTVIQTRPQKTNERTNEQKNKKLNEREIKRVSFDVFTDQEMRLNELQTALYVKTGKKPKLGSLVREALEELFKKYKNELKNE